MSQPKYYWYGIVKGQIMRGKWKKPESFQEYQLKLAVEVALKETEKLNNSEIRLKAIEQVLFNCNETYNSFGLKNHYEWRTVQNWITSFVNMVGKKAGY